MFIQFRVSNFMSIKEEAVLSMAADNNDRDHEEYLYDSGKDHILPVVAVYGANAAGKSNLFRAMTAAIMTIRESTKRQVDESLVHIIPFLFEQRMIIEPTTFDFIFTVQGRKYQYGFSANRLKIMEEYLYEYKTSRRSKIFERTNTTEYSFTKANEKELRAYVDKNTDNKLFLSTATAWNCEMTKAPYLWFSSGIDTYDVWQIKQTGLKQIENGDREMEEFLLDILKRADINIDGYHFSSQEISLEDLGVKLNRLPKPVADFLKSAQGETKGKNYEISAQHAIREADGNIREYELPFSIESNGTQRMFFFGAILKHVLEQGKTMVVDEIDIGLHPMLVKMLLQMFLDRETNTNGAQLIFSTHDVSLLSLDLFRRDQIYFVEKDQQTGNTTVYSLDEFSPQPSENVRKGYLQGRYGAIPVISQDDLLW